MKEIISEKLKYWYVPLILGLVFVGLGILVILTPLATFLTISFLFSIGFVVSGIVEIGYSLSNRKDLNNWGWYLVGGFLTLIMGLLLSARPDFTALLLSMYIGFWLLFRSIMYTSKAISLKDAGTKNWGWVLALGILSIIFSFILLWNPALAGLSLIFWLASGIITLGIINIILGFSLRKIRGNFDKLN